MTSAWLVLVSSSNVTSKMLPAWQDKLPFPALVIVPEAGCGDSTMSAVLSAPATARAPVSRFRIAPSLNVCEAFSAAFHQGMDIAGLDCVQTKRVR